MNGSNKIDLSDRKELIESLKSLSISEQLLVDIKQKLIARLRANNQSEETMNSVLNFLDSLSSSDAFMFLRFFVMNQVINHISS